MLDPAAVYGRVVTFFVTQGMEHDLRLTAVGGRLDDSQTPYPAQEEVKHYHYEDMKTAGLAFCLGIDFTCLMVIITTMNSKQIIKQLEAEGWFLARVKGSHHQFKHLSKPW